MIKKEKLLVLLKDNLDSEEKGIPIYTQHLNNVFFLSGFNKDDKAMIEGVLMKLKAESQRHGDIYARLIKKIKGSPKNVY